MTKRLILALLLLLPFTGVQANEPKLYQMPGTQVIPIQDTQAKYQIGQANNHLNFIRNDVIKTIEKNYRTLPESRTYFGYSAGGLKRKGLNANVFVSYGALEKELGEHAEKLITLLKNKNDKSLSLKRVVIESADHQAAFPMTGVRGVTWLSNLTSLKTEGE